MKKHVVFLISTLNLYLNSFIFINFTKNKTI